MDVDWEDQEAEMGGEGRGGRGRPRNAPDGFLKEEGEKE